MKAKGRPGWEEEGSRSAKCSVAGCERHAVAKGWCHTHYMRDYRGAPMDDPIGKWHGVICGAPNCGDPAKVKGYCVYHYQRWRRDADLAVEARPGIGRRRSPTGSARELAVGSRRYVREKTESGEWRPQHNVATERRLGRRLLRCERVRHLNGDGTDNRAENLEIYLTKRTGPLGASLDDWKEFVAKFIATYGDPFETDPEIALNAGRLE